MIYFRCKDKKEFQEIVALLKKIKLIYNDLLRTSPHFINLNEEQLTIHFLYTPYQLEKKIQHEGSEEPFFFSRTQFFVNEDLKDFIKEFLPAYKGLMIGNLKNSKSCLNLKISENLKTDPSIKEALRFRETYRKLHSKKKSHDKKYDTPNTFFPANTDIETSVFTNRSRTEYMKYDQKLWGTCVDVIIKKLSNWFQCENRITISNLISKLGDMRLDVAIKCKNADNYTSWNRDVGHMLTHYYGALRTEFGLRGMPFEQCLILINENIVKDFDDPFNNKMLAFPLINEKLLKKLDHKDLFKFCGTEYTEKYKYSDSITKIGDTEKNFSLYVEIRDKKEISFKICHPVLTNYDDAQPYYKLMQSRLDHILQLKNPENIEQTKLLMAHIGRLAYHLYRMLPYRLGTAAITDWLIRGLAKAKGLNIGPTMNNYSYQKENNADVNSWKELPLDWEAFLTFNEIDYGQWFTENAFQWVKNREGKLLISPLSENEENAPVPRK